MKAKGFDKKFDEGADIIAALDLSEALAERLENTDSG